MQNLSLTVSKNRLALFSFRSIFAIIYIALATLTSSSSETLALYLCFYMGVDIIFFNKLNYLNISVAFSIPWFLVLLFGMLNISTYTKNVNTETIHICAVSIFCFTIFSSGKSIKDGMHIIQESISKQWMTLCIFVFLSFSAFNILAAGYVPFLRMILTGDSGYKEFGISGIYGLFLAFSNALGLLYIYWYLKSKNKNALICYLIIMFVFVLFVTRQNIISLGIETVFVYSIMKGRINSIKILLLFSFILIVFSFIGSLRSGNIKDVASIKNDYMWIPDAIIWLYSYCYFNILNLDNLINSPGVPVYDLSSLSGFIPSFLRPESKDIYILEVSNFNVSSYLSSLYKDMGGVWVAIFTFSVAIISRRRFHKLIKKSNFKTISIAAVLYFCAFFSFFVNFWTFLPVIFQIFFIIVFDKIMIRSEISH